MMGDMLSALVVGVLSNLISDGVGMGTKYAFSKHEVDLELRRAVNNLASRQRNLEGTIEQLVNNQMLLFSSFLEVVKMYELKSQIYIENENIIIVPNNADACKLENYLKNNDEVGFYQPVEIDKFANYRKYVKRMREE